MTKFKFIILLFLTALTACDDVGSMAEPYSFTELAMQPNMVIEATNKNGTVFIEYLSPLERRYKWDKFEEKRILIPREKRWHGKLGAYNPASTYIWEVLEPRVVAEDSQLHFDNLNEYTAWLHQSSTVMDWVFTGDGLVVGFAASPDRNQVNIEVYQIYIDDEKPSNLKGNDPGRIQVFSK